MRPPAITSPSRTSEHRARRSGLDVGANRVDDRGVGLQVGRGRETGEDTLENLAKAPKVIPLVGMLEMFIYFARFWNSSVQN